MLAHSERPRWLFYLNWILLTLLGLPLAFVLNLFVVGLLTAVVGDYVYVAGVRHITEDYVGMYTFVPLAGLLTGVMQYGLLRLYLPRMGGWVAATLGGWLVGVGLALLPGWLGWAGPWFTVPLAFLVMGLALSRNAAWYFSASPGGRPAGTGALSRNWAPPW